jgi:hypothetical protein
MREAMEGDLGMSTTTKKKSAMIVVTIALVAALAVTGTLMAGDLMRADSDIAGTAGDMPDFDIELLAVRDLNENGIIEGTDDVYEYDLPANGSTTILKAVPGASIPQLLRVYLSQDTDNNGGFARVKVETTVTLGAIGYEWDKGLESYYSRLAATVYTLRDGFILQDSEKWYYDMDPTAAEKTILDKIISDAVSADDFFKVENSQYKYFTFDDNDPDLIHPTIALPDAVTITGYLYYADSRTGQIRNPILITKSALEYPEQAAITALNSVTFPKMEKKDNFMERWLSFKTAGGTFDDLTHWYSSTEATDRNIDFTHLFKPSGTYLSADNYPLAGATFLIKYQAQAIQAAVNDTTSRTFGSEDNTTSVPVGTTTTAAMYFAKYDDYVAPTPSTDDSDEMDGSDG